VKETMGKALPPLNGYGAGIVFTPKGDVAVNAIKEMFEVRGRSADDYFIHFIQTNCT